MSAYDTQVTVTITHKDVTVAQHTVTWLNGSPWWAPLEAEDAIVRAGRVAVDMLAVSLGDIRTSANTPEDAQRWPLGDGKTQPAH